MHWFEGDLELLGISMNDVKERIKQLQVHINLFKGFTFCT